MVEPEIIKKPPDTIIYDSNTKKHKVSAGNYSGFVTSSFHFEFHFFDLFLLCRLFSEKVIKRVFSNRYFHLNLNMVLYSRFLMSFCQNEKCCVFRHSPNDIFGLYIKEKLGPHVLHFQHSIAIKNENQTNF